MENIFTRKLAFCLSILLIAMLFGCGSKEGENDQESVQEADAKQQDVKESKKPYIPSRDILTFIQKLRVGAMQVKAQALLELKQLGPKAKGILIDVMLVAERESKLSKLAFEVLESIGSFTKEDVRILVYFLASDNSEIRARAALELSLLGKEAEPAKPELEQMTSDEDKNAADSARTAMRSITQQREPVHRTFKFVHASIDKDVEASLKMLGIKDGETVNNAVKKIREAGKRAKTAIPHLKALEIEASTVRVTQKIDTGLIRTTLHEIGPAAREDLSGLFKALADPNEMVKIQALILINNIRIGSGNDRVDYYPALPALHDILLNPKISHASEGQMARSVIWKLTGYMPKIIAVQVPVQKPDKPKVEKKPSTGTKPEPIAKNIEKETFAEFPIKQITSMSISEDGKYLLVCRPMDQKVTIWDIAAEKETASINTSMPYFAISRKDSIYVANTSHRTVSVYSNTPGYALKFKVSLGAKSPYYITAPRGSHFDGKLLISAAVTLTGRTQRANYVLDSRTQKLIEIRSSDLLLPIYLSGMHICTQGQYIKLSDASTLLTSRRYYSISKLTRNKTWLYHGKKQGYIFGGSDILGGNPLQVLGSVPDGFLVPDSNKEVFYVIKLNAIETRKTDMSMSVVGKYQKKCPDVMKSADILSYDKPVIRRPAAATLNEMTYFFIPTSDPKSLVYHYMKVPHNKLVTKPEDIQSGYYAIDMSKTTTQSGGVKFSKLPLSYPCTSVNITEDGRFLVVCHEISSFVSIWDIWSGKQIKLIPCKYPRFALCRRGSVFIANRGMGIITVLSRNADWSVTKTIEIPSKYPVYISAKQGDAFDNRLLISCKDEPKRVLIDINTGMCRTFKDPYDSGISTFTRSGDKIIEYTSRKRCIVYDYMDFVKGETKAAANNRLPTLYSNIYQAKKGVLWFDLKSIYSGSELKQHMKTDGLFIVPDIMSDTFYEVRENRLIACKTNLGMNVLWEEPLHVPPEFKHFKSLNKFNPADPIISRPIAVTKNNSTFIFIKPPNVPVLYYAYISGMKKSIKPIVASIYKDSNDKHIECRFLPTKYAVTTMALTEDNNYLVVAHEESNILTVWDIVKGVMIREISCPFPRHLLSRGNIIYVANYGKSLISILPTDTWEMKDVLSAGDDKVYYLSAPQGSSFRNKLFASTGRYTSHVVYLIDTTGKEKPVEVFKERHMSVATIGIKGRQVILQGDTTGSPIGRVKVFDYRVFVRRQTQNKQASVINTPVLFQAGTDSCWFGGNGVYEKEPLKPVNTFGSLVIPDYTEKKIFYVIDLDSIERRKVDSLFKKFGEKPAKFPEGIDFRMLQWGNRSRETYKFGNPAAVTFNENTYLFFIDWKKNRIIYARIPNSKNWK